MALKYSTALNNARQNQITTLLGTAGTLNIYSGTRPANPQTAMSGNTLLATLNLSNPAAAGAASGVLTFSAIAQDNAANATGTATWFSVQDGSSNRIIEGDVSGIGGGGDLQLSSTSIVVGGPVLVSSFVLTEATQ
jgi:tRNA-binding EMAP/Myf-like protein